MLGGLPEDQTDLPPGFDGIVGVPAVEDSAKWSAFQKPRVIDPRMVAARGHQSPIARIEYIRALEEQDRRLRDAASVTYYGVVSETGTDGQQPQQQQQSQQQRQSPLVPGLMASRHQTSVIRRTEFSGSVADVGPGISIDRTMRHRVRTKEMRKRSKADTMEELRQRHWRSYATTWAASVTNPTIGDGSIASYYLLEERHCLLSILLTIGATTTVGSGNYSFTLPIKAATGVQILMTALFTDVSPSPDDQYPCWARIASGGGSFTLITQGGLVGAAVPVVPATGDLLAITGVYPVDPLAAV